MRQKVAPETFRLETRITSLNMTAIRLQHSSVSEVEKGK